jgi:hypothetical protein
MLKEIESYLGWSIKVMEIEKNDHADTLDFTNDIDDNWKRLLKEEKEKTELYLKKKKKKKKKK